MNQAIIDMLEQRSFYPYDDNPNRYGYCIHWDKPFRIDIVIEQKDKKIELYAQGKLSNGTVHTAYEISIKNSLTSLHKIKKYIEEYTFYDKVLPINYFKKMEKL